MSAEQFFTVESAQKKIFKISAGALRHSLTLSNLVKNLGASVVSGTSIPIEKMSDATLKTIIDWCEHHRRDAVKPSVGKDICWLELPEWDARFLRSIVGEDLHDLICAVNYLHIEELLDYTCKKVADMARGKDPHELRTFFMIPSNRDDEGRRDAAAGSSSH